MARPTAPTQQELHRWALQRCHSDGTSGNSRNPDTGNPAASNPDTHNYNAHLHAVHSPRDTNHQPCTRDPALHYSCANN